MGYWFLRRLVVILLRSLFRFKVECLKNLPTKTNFIIAANHSSYLDPLVVMAAVPRKIYCIAMRVLFTIPSISWFLKMAEAIPDGYSSEKAMCMLIQNNNIGLFPEGGISRDGALREFRKGGALLAIRTGRPIVPCAIIGTREALPKTAKFPRLFRAIKVKIGEPIYLPEEFDDIIDDVYLQEGTAKIRSAIKEMIDAK